MTCINQRITGEITCPTDGINNSTMLDIVFSNIPELIDDVYIDTTSGLKSDHLSVTIKLGVNTRHTVSLPNTRLLHKLYSATEDTWVLLFNTSNG